MTISADILFPQITSWENLLKAYHKAARGKRGRYAAAAFEQKLADRLLTLQADLRQGSYQPGKYRHFVIHEPKRRLISAAPFRDRVVHHAVCNLVEPLFEARFHSHSYANRVGKGTHRALDQLQQFARQNRYVLRLDIVQHFPSIDHLLLKNELFRVVQGEKTQQLIASILQSGEGVLVGAYSPIHFPGDMPGAVDRARGLPIGNLTSQFWSNCYLNPLDWFVTRTLGCRAYLRYVDDFALFANNKRLLWRWHSQIIEFLAGWRLTLHETHTHPAKTVDGIPWLGFIVFPSHRRLKRRNVVQFRKRLVRNIGLFHQGEITFGELDASVQGWINHVRYGDSWGLRKNLFARHSI